MENIIDEEKMYHIRPYINDDYEFIYQTKKNAYKRYVEECWGEWVEETQRSHFSQFMNYVQENIYIIELNNTKIGFYNGEDLEDGSYEIGNICIIPEYQGRGIGTEILQEIIENHKNQDIRLQCFKQNPVKNLYQKLGFKPSGETEFHYQMIRPKTNVYNLK